MRTLIWGCFALSLACLFACSSDGPDEPEPRSDRAAICSTVGLGEECLHPGADRWWRTVWRQELPDLSERVHRVREEPLRLPRARLRLQHEVLRLHRPPSAEHVSQALELLQALTANGR